MWGALNSVCRKCEGSIPTLCCYWQTGIPNPKLLLLSSDHFAWQPPPSVYEWWSCKVLWEDWKSAVEVKVLLLSTSPVKVQYSWMKFVFQVFIFAPMITYDRWCKWDNFKGFLFCPWKWLIQCIKGTEPTHFRFEAKSLKTLVYTSVTVVTAPSAEWKQWGHLWP